MNILIITPRPPYPLFSGGEHAQFHFLEAMRSEHTVSICFEVNRANYNDFQDLKKIWPDVEFYPWINIEHVKRIKKFKQYILNKILPGVKKVYKLILNGEKIELDFVRQNSLIRFPILMIESAFINHVSETVQNHKFDIIQVEFINYAPFIYILPKKCMKVLVHHELRYVRVKREVDLFKKREAFDTCRLGVIKDQEISLLNKFDKIITLTEVDKKILESDVPREKIYVSPATIRGKETQTNNFIPFVNKLVFIGSSLHLPNTEGLNWFIESVFPLIENNLPDIHLDIIGSWTKDFIKQYTRENVNFKGVIKDLDDEFKAALLIVPIRIGSGMRLKIVEAINHKIPFISTTIGIEGLDFQDNIDCVIADSVEDFANGICSLSGNSLKQEELVDHASSKIKEVCSYELAIKKRLDFYKQLA